MQRPPLRAEGDGEAAEGGNKSNQKGWRSQQGGSQNWWKSQQGGGKDKGKGKGKGPWLPCPCGH